MATSSPLNSPSNAAAAASLRKQTAGYLLFGTIALISTYAYLQRVWHPAYALRWLTLSAAVFAYHLITLWRGLHRNRRAAETDLLPTFGPGTVLTLTRGLIFAMLAGFLLSPRPNGFWLLAWLPAILKIIADFTDFFDGYLARISDHATELGLLLDEHFDGLGVLIVTLLAYQYGTVPWWYLPVGFARYLYLFGLWLRHRRGLPIYDLRPNVSRRGLAGLQMGFTTAMLFPVFSPPGTAYTATLFMLPFLAGFLYDWLTVSGTLQEPAASTARLWNRVWRFISQPFPLLLRGGVVIIMASWRPAISIAELVVLVMLGLGAAARPIAVLALLLLGVRLQADLFTFAHAALLFFYTVILFVGSGSLSLWRPLDYLVSHRAGERRSS